MANRVYFDQSSLPPPHRQVDHCLRCGEPGTMVVYNPDGREVLQMHCVHFPWLKPCPECNQDHPRRVCVIETWPPTKWMRHLISFHNQEGLGRQIP